jgi:hypothetical protein
MRIGGVSLPGRRLNVSDFSLVHAAALPSVPVRLLGQFRVSAQRLTWPRAQAHPSTHPIARARQRADCDRPLRFVA